MCEKLVFFQSCDVINGGRSLILADETETINDKDELDEDEVTNGVTNINMGDQTEGDKKKPRRRGGKKKEEPKEQKPESKDKKQTNPPSIPIHVLYPTSKYQSHSEFNKSCQIIVITCLK